MKYLLSLSILLLFSCGSNEDYEARRKALRKQIENNSAQKKTAQPKKSEKKKRTVVPDSTSSQPPLSIDTSITTAVEPVKDDPEKHTLQAPKLTYVVRNKKQVQYILDILAKNKYKDLRKANLPIELVDTAKLNRMFSLDNGDPEVLKFIDEICDRENQRIANRLNVDLRHFYKESKTINKILEKQ